MLRLPEADLAAVCAATGLSRDRATAVLLEADQDIGLLAATDPGQAWRWPGGHGLRCGLACAAGRIRGTRTASCSIGCSGCYQGRVHALLMRTAALARTDLGRGHGSRGRRYSWPVRPVVATALDVARTGVARAGQGVAPIYLVGDQQVGGWAAGVADGTG